MAMSKFERGFGRAAKVFNCRCCKRSTRHVDQDQAGCGDICFECYELAGIENTCSDYGWEDEMALQYKSEARTHLANLSKKGIEVSTVWPELVSWTR